MKMSKHTLRAACLGAILCLAGCSAQALPSATGPARVANSASGKTAEDRSADRLARLDVQNQQLAKQRKVVAEASIALEETHRALDDLAHGRKAAALASIEKASRKLNAVLVREPRLALAPVATSCLTRDVLATPQDVDRMVKDARRLLDEGKLQAARSLLSDLASETVFSVTSLPLQTYPDALELAGQKVKEGNLGAAGSVLRAALDTQVVTQVTVPLPVLRARHSLEAAEQLAEKTHRSTEESEKLRRLLDSAERSVRLGEALGYGSPRDFETYFQEIEKIREKTSGGRSGRGLFDRIKSALKSLAP